MRIQKVRVEGFRLLADVDIMLEETSTVIVGRNNSGKTSLTDVFDRIVGEASPRFRLEDFSAGIRPRFDEARQLRASGSSAEEVLAALPKITVTITFLYEADASDLGPLSPFIIDLDAASTTAIARVEYGPALATLQKLFEFPAPAAGANERAHFYKCLKENLPKAYSIKVAAIDPTDPENLRNFEGTAALSAVLQCSLVRAQRTLDSAKNGDADVIGKLLGTLFKTATAPNAAATDQDLTVRLKASVEAIERGVQSDFDELLTGLLPALEAFGFPGLNDTKLRPETSLNVEALLSDHTKIVYAGTDGVHLPEGYNGLGTRNLIYMLLQLESYHKAYRARATRPGIHLIFIEEPEAHLHPQMQEVFIKQLNEAAAKLSEKYPNEPTWKVQFVISTHSAHLANAAKFDAIRYFLNEQPTAGGPRRTKVKDFRRGAATISPQDQEFLHQYMTLTKCDLYFADKAILIEGVTERILMPRLREIVDSGLEDAKKLTRQYITVVEVGGAYAHLFYPLLDFLELRTLVITDLDTVHQVPKTNRNGSQVNKWEKCPVAEGQSTSNAAIREWFRPNGETADGEQQNVPAPHLTPQALAAKTNEEKANGVRRIAYQVPEDPDNAICARSFEDALILANPGRFTWEGEPRDAAAAWEIAANLSKAETALRFAIREQNWNVPRYIKEGLIWLAEPPPPPAVAPAVDAPVQQDSTPGTEVTN
ncbi:ATP-dependent nuclease [Undibacterium umbellatum]|uniref:AAA family ATPase n=1 Tax=Undibacterium umbellatum TaxID=2762300 RepID=A0ABR6ZGR4_9BURK|nr:AAA family ATPase [Undibacterium umbellatum]MBC3910926.1 AAA family ATPase [Undibacterium umbellatum]